MLRRIGRIRVCGLEKLLRLKIKAAPEVPPLFVFIDLLLRRAHFSAKPRPASPARPKAIRTDVTCRPGPDKVKPPIFPAAARRPKRTNPGPRNRAETAARSPGHSPRAARARREPRCRNQHHALRHRGWHHHLRRTQGCVRRATGHAHPPNGAGRRGGATNTKRHRYRSYN